jgi:hypothetical protein
MQSHERRLDKLREPLPRRLPGLRAAAAMHTANELSSHRSALAWLPRAGGVSLATAGVAIFFHGSSAPRVLDACGAPRGRG